MNPWLKLIENITVAILMSVLSSIDFWLDPDEVCPCFLASMEL